MLGAIRPGCGVAAEGAVGTRTRSIPSFRFSRCSASTINGTTSSSAAAQRHANSSGALTRRWAKAQQKPAAMNRQGVTMPMLADPGISKAMVLLRKIQRSATNKPSRAIDSPAI